MKHTMHGTLADNAAKIKALIEEEDRNGIPSGSVENYVPLGQHSRETNGWFVTKDTDKYIYLNRADGYDVTVQKCQFGNLTYYMVYVEKNRTDEIRNDPRELVEGNQSVCHTFRWVRSLKHAMKLGESGSEMFLGLANYDDYFLTKEERNNAFEGTSN